MEEKPIENLVADYRNSRLSRRGFLRAATALVGVTVAESLLISCQANPPTAEEVKESVAEATSAPVVPSVIISPVDRMVINWEDCTRYKKDPPWSMANPTQGPTNSWALMLDGHTDYGRTEKYKDYFDEYYYADSGGNAAKQISDLESILVKNPDIIIGGALGAAGKSIFDQAYDMGIPLVIGQLPYVSDKYTSFVNPDNWIIGAKFADWIARKLNGEGKIVMTSGIAGTDTAETRLSAAKEIFANYPGIEVLAHGYMDWSISKAKQGFEAWLASYPEIDAVWSDSAFMAWGAIEAFVEANRDIPPITAEPLNGFLRLAKQYDVDFFARGYPNAYGLDFVDMAVSVLMGEVVPRFKNIPSTEFEKNKLDFYFKPEASDDLWVDYRFPYAWIEKMFPK
jgi:ribose transport system substrate-binding protein